MLFANETIEIWKRPRNDGYTILVKNDANRARKLNRILACYDKGVKFTDLDEPTFKFSASQIEYIAAEDPFMGRILAQTFKGMVG